MLLCVLQYVLQCVLQYKLNDTLRYVAYMYVCVAARVAAYVAVCVVRWNIDEMTR